MLRAAIHARSEPERSPLPSMWTILDRALRRFRSCPPADAASGGLGPLRGAATDDIVFALGPREFERLGRALGEATGSKIRPDTPDLLTTALSAAITRTDGHGVPHVWRSPAGLHTTEYWQIRIDGADDATRVAIRHAIRGGAFA